MIMAPDKPVLTVKRNFSASRPADFSSPSPAPTQSHKYPNLALLDSEAWIALQKRLIADMKALEL